MKLSELKAIGEKRTPGAWVHDDGCIGNDGEDIPGSHKMLECLRDGPQYDKFAASWVSLPAQYGCECRKHNSDNDGEFIAAAFENWDKLISVADAAKNYKQAVIQRTINESAQTVCDLILAHLNLVEALAVLGE